MNRFNSYSNIRKSPSAGRNPAMSKKIKELEEEVGILKDIIKKAGLNIPKPKSKKIIKVKKRYIKTKHKKGFT